MEDYKEQLALSRQKKKKAAEKIKKPKGMLRVIAQYC